jgi:hypothetical protein
MSNLFFFYGEKTCDLLQQFWLETGRCHLLNITKPLSLTAFRAQYIEIGQQSVLVSFAVASILLIFIWMNGRRI